VSQFWWRTGKLLMDALGRPMWGSSPTDCCCPGGECWCDAGTLPSAYKVEFSGVARYFGVTPPPSCPEAPECDDYFNATSFELPQDTDNHCYYPLQLSWVTDPYPCYGSYQGDWHIHLMLFDTYAEVSVTAGYDGTKTFRRALSNPRDCSAGGANNVLGEYALIGSGDLVFCDWTGATATVSLP